LVGDDLYLEKKTASEFGVKSLTVYELTVYAWFENEHLAFDVAVKLFMNKSNKRRVKL